MLDLSRQENLLFPAFELLLAERKLEFESVPLGKDQIGSLAKAISQESSEIRFLGLSNTKLGKEVRKVAESIAKSDKIEYLDLSFNGLDDHLVEETLLPALDRNFSLISVNLQGNDLKHRTLNAVDQILRRNQHKREQILAARTREVAAMTDEERAVRLKAQETAALVAEVEAVQQRRIARIEKLKRFWASEAAKAEVKELEMLTALTVEAEERKEGRKGKKGKKGKK